MSPFNLAPGRALQDALVPGLASLEDLPTAYCFPDHYQPLGSRGGSSSTEDFFPVVSLLLAGSLVVAFHLQSPQSIPKFTLTGDRLLQQPYRLWASHWIHFSEAHFFRNVVNVLTHGILCERTLGAVDFLEATLWGLLVTSLWAVILLPRSDKFALAHAQGVGFSTVVCFWMGLSFLTGPWWHRVWCFLGIFVADVLLFTNKERGTLHHWIGVVNGLVYAQWKHYGLKSTWGLGTAIQKNKRI